MVVAGSRIVALVPKGAPDPAGAEVFDASRHVVVPGLINTHHHAYQTLTRAFPPSLNRELFGWLGALYPVWARLTPDALETAATVAFAELLLSGCTTAADHHYVFPRGLEHAVDVEVSVARRLGLRVHLSRGSMNLSQRDGGLPPDGVVQDSDTILADCERVVGAFHERGDDAFVRVALAPCSPFTVTPELMRDTSALAERLDVRLHTHLAETADEDAFCQARFGCRPLEYLERQGWLTPRTWLAHGVHFAADEWPRLAAAGVSVSHCACSNQVLGSGHCPVCDLEAAGVAVGLGVDGSASNNSSNMVAEVRAAFLLQRGRYGVARVSHLDALRWATEGGAACLGRPELGRIKVGVPADLALFTLDELRFAGAADPVAALVLCGAQQADRVMVGGRWVVEGGAIPGLDVPALVARQRQMADRLAKA